MKIDSEKIVVIGAGAMGGALISGLVEKQLFSPDSIIVSDVRKEQLNSLHQSLGITVADSNKEAINLGEIIICAVKPAQMDSVLTEISPYIKSNQLFISIAAGISLEFLEKYLQKNVAVIRAMPNLPALVGEGITALALGKSAKAEDQEKAEKVFKALGQVVTLPEKNLDAVTGLSGSGPAYVFVILEALADGGVKMGLTREISMRLAIQTVIGAAKMVQETGEHPGVLKDRVASPGGSTISGLHVLEKSGLRGILISAVEAATKRAKELQ